MTFRTVFRDNRKSRQICLIDLPSTKCARLIFERAVWARTSGAHRLALHNQHPGLLSHAYEEASDQNYQGVTFGLRSPQDGGQFCMPFHRRIP